MIDDWKEVERYATAKPSKDLGGDCTNRRCVSQSLFSLFFVRAVRVKKNLVACKSLPRVKARGMPNAPTPLLTKEGDRRAACKYLYPGSKPGACLMPPRPSLQRRGKKGGVRGGGGAIWEWSFYSLGLPGTEAWNFLSLNNRTHGKADPFLRQTQDRRVAQDDKKRKREGYRRQRPWILDY